MMLLHGSSWSTRSWRAVPLRATSAVAPPELLGVRDVTCNINFGTTFLTKTWQSALK
jgi:hypothetical protein